MTQLNKVEQRLASRIPSHTDNAYRHILDLIHTIRKAKELAP